MAELEEQIVRLLAERGPCTGAELRERLGDDGFEQWKTCMLADRLMVRRVGRRYLRLDQRVDGYARLSPSILREFLTYSVVGLTDDPEALAARRATLAEHIASVTAAKWRLAERIIADIGARLLGSGEGPEERFCVLLAGDIVYEMAHDAPRPERSTGRMVRGSDLDLVAIMHDDASEELAASLDEAIYQQKYRNLINPSVREEMDYTVKPFSRFREQAGFDTFKHMVSCKIADEAVLLYGSRSLYLAVKEILIERKVTEKLAAMEQEAVYRRERAERQLLSKKESRLGDADLYLFYTTEESEEFE